MKNIKIEKKDGNLQDYQPQKIKAAISKSANRVDVELSTEEQNNVVRFVEKQITDHPNFAHACFCRKITG